MNRRIKRAIGLRRLKVYSVNGVDFLLRKGMSPTRYRAAAETVLRMRELSQVRDQR